MIFQDLNLASPIVASLRQARPTIRLATIFLIIRRKNYFCFIGDYPIASEVVRTVCYQNQRNASKEVVQIFRQSAELKKYARVSSVLVKSLCLDI